MVQPFLFRGDMNSKRKILEKLEIMATQYSNVPDTKDKEIWRLYLDVLDGYDTDLVLKALDEYLRTSPYPNFPKIPNILSKIFELQEAEREKQYPSIGDAWAEVLRKVSNIKRTESPTFSHDIITQTVKDIGGYKLIRDATDQTANRSKFYQRYEENIK